MTAPNPVTRRRLLGAGAGLLVSASLGGCLGEGAAGGEPSLPDAVEVTMTSMPMPKFEPRLAHVAVGGTVTWTHHSGDHDTTSYHPDTYGPMRIPPDAEPWASRTLNAVGESFEHRFDLAGVYDYVDTQAVCTAHEGIGNVGRVVVGWPAYDPEAQPALRPPQESLPRIARSRIEELNEETRTLLAEERAEDA